MARNNETTTKFKVDISELKSAMQEARKQVAYANSEFKAVSSSLDDWSKSSDGLKAKLKQLNSNLESQETVLNEYEKTLEEIKKQYGENSKEALEYATKLNNQQAVVNKIKKEMDGYEDALKEVSEAEKIASKTGKDVAEVLADVGDEAEDAEGGFTVFKGAIADFVGNALTSLVSGLKDAITNMATFGDEVDKAMNSFQASTGATAEEMAEFEDSMKNIYNANFGESFDDIAKSMGEVKKVAGDIGAGDLEKMTTNALILRDTFDFEVSESMRAVNSLMDQFGITSDQAFNLMAQGAQQGLNQNGDLLDVINEYAVHFESAGYSADEMFNMLANGVESGTWSVDKLGDAVKEFNIRMTDGSAKDAVEALGFSWDEVRESWRKGGDEAKDVFNMLVNELDGMERSTDGYGIGVGLLGTMYEDLGQDAVLALSNIDGEFNKSKDTMEQINSIKYDSVGEALQGIGRNLETGLLIPISEKILPIVSDLASKFSEWLNDPATQESIKTLTDNIGQFVDKGLEVVKTAFQWLLDNKDAIIAGLVGIGTGFLVFNVATTIMTVTTALKAFTNGLTLAQVAMKLFNLVVGANPILKLVSIIIAVVSAIAVFIATNDEARAKFLEIWGNIVASLGEFVASIGKFFTETIPAFFQSLLNWVQENWQSLLLFFINPFAGLFKYFYDNNVKFREFVDNAILEIKQLPEKAWVWLQNTIAKVTTWFTQMTNKARETGLTFLNKIIEFVSQLPEKIWTQLVNAINKVTQFATDLANKATEAGKNFVTNLVNAVSGVVDKMKTIGSNIVDGIWSGISSGWSWLKDKVSNLASSLYESAKNALGINSPSKVFADEVGKWIPAGIAVGVDKNAKTAIDSVKNLAVDTLGGARAGLGNSTTVSGGAGSVVNNFTQVINSPKELSRLEIYRQSKNLLGYAGGGV